jgi:hypothetical protein
MKVFVKVIIVKKMKVKAVAEEAAEVVVDLLAEVDQMIVRKWI